MDEHAESAQPELMRERVLNGDFAPEPLCFDQSRDDGAEHHPLQQEQGLDLQ